MKATCEVYVLGLLFAVAFAACQRPFEASPPPRIDIIEPDLDFVQMETQMPLAVRVTSPSTIEEVIFNSDTLTYDESDNVWRGVLLLANGLNRLIASVTDADMRMTLDTTYAIADHLTYSAPPPHLPSPRGGHTATVLDDGTLVVIGGAPHATGPGLSTAIMAGADEPQFEPVPGEMAVARTGHSATLLPDGRILIVGGSKSDDIRMMDDLIEDVEIFDPATGTFEMVSVDGEPIRRANHTASLHQEGGALFVDLYGGTGDISYQPPVLGTRSDVRRFEFRGESLIPLDPAPGPMLREMLSGHTLVELYPNALGERRFYISGADFDGIQRSVSFEIDYDLNLGLLQHVVGPNYEARTRHAATLLRDGFVGLFGGRQESPDEVLNRIEIYSAIAQRSFPYHMTENVRPRYAHTATKISDLRIRMIGGFSSTGEGMVTSELYRIPLFENGLTGTGGR